MISMYLLIMTSLIAMNLKITCIDWKLILFYLSKKRFFPKIYDFQILFSFDICISIPSNSHWARQWSIRSLVHMSSHYWISKHRLRYANNFSNSLNFNSNSLLPRLYLIHYPILLHIQLVLPFWQHLCWVQQPFPFLWLLYLHQVIEQLLLQHVIGFQQLLFLTLLVELCWHEIDNVPICDYPLVFTML